ncbi:MAG: N-acetyl-alpha-D-glucosaminyl L-malate synthase BshA [Candidatus Thorarchaeota archaeon]
MRIGITCYPGVGGSGLLATRLGVELAKRKHQVRFITYEVPFELQEGHHENVKVDLVDVLEYPLFRYPPYTVSLASKLANVAQKHKLDLLHVHYAIPHAVSAYIAHQMTGIPYIVTLHGSDVHTLGADPAYQPATKFAVEAAHAVTCVTRHICETAERTLGIRCSIDPITNFTYNEIFKPNACEFPIANGKRQLIHVSNFRPVKRVSDLVTAFAQIAEEVPDVDLLLIGDGPTRPDVDRLIRKFELQNRIRCPGFKRDVYRYLRCGHAFALSSELEGAPLSLLEAMSCGLPVVATEVGGIPEIITDSENGLLVPLGDIDAMADKLFVVLTDSMLANRLGKQARQAILERHTVDKVVPQYEAIYERVLSS